MKLFKWFVSSIALKDDAAPGVYFAIQEGGFGDRLFIVPGI